MKNPKSPLNGTILWPGVLAIGLISLAALPSIGAAPPVVRAKGNSPQVPLCYMDGLSTGRQNLDATCLMGKPKTKAIRPFDLTTDRDNDGVPDDVNDFFNRMEEAARGGPSTEGVAQMESLFKELAARSPLNAEQKATLNQMGESFRSFARPASSQPSDQDIQRSAQAAERLGKLMQEVEKTPFMQQMNEFSSRRDANRRKQMEQDRKTSKPAPIPVR